MVKVQITPRIPADLYRILRKAAEKSGLSQTILVISALEFAAPKWKRRWNITAEDLK